MRKAVLLIAALMLLVVPASHAWPACSGSWVQVPAGTKGTASSGIGAVTVEGNVTWQCQDPKPPSNPTSNTNTNSNSNANSNLNNNTNKQSQGQGQGQTQGQGQGQQQTANGGAGGQGGQGGAGGNGYGGKVSDSGNSHNTNTNTATTGPSTATATGGDSSATSTSGANNNGNGSNNASYSNTENVAASKIPVATAYAGTPAPTALCALGYGGGLQFASVGLSGGGARIDQNCAILEAARQGATYAGKLAFCKLYVSNKNVKKAGYTLTDCLGDTLNVPPPAPIPQVAEVIPSAPPTRVLVQIDPNPAPKITPPLVTDQPNVQPAVVTKDETKTLTRMGTFHLTTQMSNGACPTKFVCLTSAAKAVLDKAIAAAKADPSITVVVEGNLRNAGACARYMAKSVDRSRISIRSDDDSTSDVDVYTWQ